MVGIGYGALLVSGWITPDAWGTSASAASTPGWIRITLAPLTVVPLLVTALACTPVASPTHSGSVPARSIPSGVDGSGPWSSSTWSGCQSVQLPSRWTRTFADTGCVPSG